MYTFVKGVLLVSNPSLPIAELEYKDSEVVLELSAIECGDVIVRNDLEGEWTATFAVYNSGKTNLTIGEITLTDVTSGVEVSASQPTSTSLYPGQSAQFDVVFQQHESITHVDGQVNIPTDANPNCSIVFDLNYAAVAENYWEIADIPENGSGSVPLSSSVNFLSSIDYGGGLRSYNILVTNNGPATLFPEGSAQVISQPEGENITVDVTKIFEGETETSGTQAWNVGVTGGGTSGIYVFSVTIPGYKEVQITVDFTFAV
jgi:hypothetical protein